MLLAGRGFVIGWSVLATSILLTVGIKRLPGLRFRFSGFLLAAPATICVTLTVKWLLDGHLH